MCSSQRSAVACREFGITAGTFLIMAILVLRVDAQSTDAVSLGEEVGTTLILLTTPSVDSVTTTVTPLVDSIATNMALPTESTMKDTSKPQNELFSTAPSIELSTSMVTDMNAPTKPSNTSGGAEHDQEIEIEFIIIIAVTIIIVVAVMIVIAALIYWCLVKRRDEKQSRFVKFKKSRGKRHKYDKMDVEMGTLPRNEPSGGGWIFNTNETVDDNELEPMNLSLQTSKVTNENYDPEMNGNIETAPSISDYHSETNPVVAPLSLEDDDNDLNVNPMYSLGRSSRGSVKDSGIHEAGGDDLPDGDMSIRSDNELQSFADETVEL